MKPAVITKHIKQAQTVKQLRGIVIEHSPVLNCIQISSLFSQFANVVSSNELGNCPAGKCAGVFNGVLASVRHNNRTLPESLQISDEALDTLPMGRMGYSWVDCIEEEPTELFTLLLHAALKLNRVLDSQGVATALYTTARVYSHLQYALLLPDTNELLHSFIGAMCARACSSGLLNDATPHTLTNLAWASAKLYCTECLPSAGLLQTLRAAVTVAAHKLQHYGSRNISNLLWALAAARIRPSTDFISSALEHLPLSRCNQQDLSNTIWALARLQYLPRASWLHDFDTTVHILARTFEPRSTAMTLWALAKLPGTPSMRCTALLVARVHRQASQLDARLSAAVACAMPRLQPWPGARHARVLVRLARLAEVKAATYGAREAACLVWCLARARQPVPASLTSALLDSLAHPGARPANAHHMAQLLRALAMAGVVPPPGWLPHFLNGGLVLRAAGPRDLSVMLWSLARMQGTVELDDPLRKAFLHKLAAELPSWPLASASLALWSAARLQLPLQSEWFDQVLQSFFSAQRLPSNAQPAARDMVMLLVACAASGHRPRYDLMLACGNWLQAHVTQACHPHTIRDAMWALARLDIPPPLPLMRLHVRCLEVDAKLAGRERPAHQGQVALQQQPTRSNQDPNQGDCSSKQNHCSS